MPSVATVAADSAASTSAACPAISVFAAFLAWTARGRDENAVDGGSVPLSKDTFDFVVVGGGSAGCVLAARLSEVPAWRVLLLEAGLEEPPEAQVPATYRNLQMTGMNWGYQSEPEPGHCNGTGCPCPKGRVLGGTGAINGFVYIRGSPRDYDEWAAVLEDDGWSYSGVLPFFLRSENALDEDLAADAEHHGVGGPLAVSRPASRDPVNDVLFEAMKNIGLVEGDPNGASQLGYSASQVTVAGGERMSANRAFLEPARNRSNLEVRTGVHVTRVLIVGAEAVGVEFRDRDGVSSRAYAAREVVLTAGVMNTPQILMLSGVGPKEHLAALGIEVVSDLPAVGENLMNHVTSLGVQYLLPPGWPGPGANVSRRVEDFAHFVPGGPLSSLGPEEVNAFCKLDAASPGGTPTAAATADRPDINLRFYGLVPKVSVGQQKAKETPASPQPARGRFLSECFGGTGASGASGSGRGWR
ncbi:hypothetical protein ONE63_001254 [Megalurothrips usitatus]|uniref:Glucose-methanol-choline oxidoreductase N-terminal domain-containing protein n=1 Tax=Megalurothrips usitatus TaxID=439358 RepID=A0AAV7XEM6_9NEOP|nr:hypothetical protein ONE63_001254 [Megalurothrips usitatus]